MTAEIKVNMAAPMKNMLRDIYPGNKCVIEATVVTGFENLAKGEVSEKLDVPVHADKGKIRLQIPFDEVHKIQDLQSVDNLYVVIGEFRRVQYGDTTEEALTKLETVIFDLEWRLGLDVWAKLSSYETPVSVEPRTNWKENFSVPIPQTNTSCNKNKGSVNKSTDTLAQESVKPVHKNDTDSNTTGDVNTDETSLIEKTGSDIITESDDITGSDITTSPISQKGCQLGKRESPSNNGSYDSKKRRVPHNPGMPSFRATCYRSGGKHVFQSPQLACHFGGRLQDYFGWNVDLTEFDMEIVITVEACIVYVAVGLTKRSMHRRNIVQFGSTTLRPTIAYGMLRFCDIKPGDVVCDPMCGGGTIPLESAINWTDTMHICGELARKACNRTRENLAAINNRRLLSNKRSLSMDLVPWDVTNLPLRDESVDVFITDMPFGKRSGSKANNWQLYPRALTEMARACRRESGRACLLTQDRKCIIKTLECMEHLWTRSKYLPINIGGLAAGVYLLYRSGVKATRDTHIDIGKRSAKVKPTKDATPVLITDKD